MPKGLALAPMAGATNLAFRLLARRFGASLTVTEMVSAKGLILGNDRTLHYLERDESETPVGAQLFGSEPHFMAEATRKVADAGFHLVDINMGCPVPKITGQGAGCSMMQTPDKAAAVVESMAKVGRLPVTVKIRAGWSEENRNAPAFAQVLEKAGASAITVHARTGEQRYSGKADWALIGEVKAAVKIPVLGNGDVDSPEKAAELLKVSGCDGIAIGRGALNSPWIFRDILAFRERGEILPPPTRKEIGEMILSFAKDLIRLYEEKTAILMMRRFASDFSRGLRAGNRFRQELMKATRYEELESLTLQNFMEQEFPEPSSNESALSHAPEEPISHL